LEIESEVWDCSGMYKYEEKTTQIKPTRLIILGLDNRSKKISPRIKLLHIVIILPLVFRRLKMRRISLESFQRSLWDIAYNLDKQVTYETNKQYISEEWEGEQANDANQQKV
jgi:hypothetical protein